MEPKDAEAPVINALRKEVEAWFTPEALDGEVELTLPEPGFAVIALGKRDVALPNFITIGRGPRRSAGVKPLEVK